MPRRDGVSQIKAILSCRCPGPAAGFSRGRVEWRRAQFRPTASVVSALSSIVANNRQAMPNVSSTPSIHSVRWVFPSTVGSQPCHPAPFRRYEAAFDAGPAVRPFLAFLNQASGTAAVPTGPWLNAVYHVRACNRYYGLMRRSCELRPIWLKTAYFGRSLPFRAVRLTFPSFL